MSTANYGDIIEVIAPADFHVHLRDGELSKLVTPHVHEGGFYLAYVMVRANHLSVHRTTIDLTITAKSRASNHHYRDGDRI
jgi:dihydroorotase